jgi:hypothetical protein
MKPSDLQQCHYSNTDIRSRKNRHFKNEESFRNNGRVRQKEDGREDVSMTSGSDVIIQLVDNQALQNNGSLEHERKNTFP